MFIVACNFFFSIVGQDTCSMMARKIVAVLYHGTAMAYERLRKGMCITSHDLHVFCSWCALSLVVVQLVSNRLKKNLPWDKTIVGWAVTCLVLSVP